MNLHTQETYPEADAIGDMADITIDQATDQTLDDMVDNVVDNAAYNVITVEPMPRIRAFMHARTLGEYLAGDKANSSILWKRMGDVRITPTLQLLYAEYPEPLNLVAVISPDVPDVVGVLPVWAALARSCPRAELRIICDDELWLLQQVLGDDAGLDLDTMDLPLLLLLDDDFQLQAQWGPRPQAAEPYLEEWLARNPEFEALAEDESAEGMQAFSALNDNLTMLTRVWYNSDLDAACCEELIALLESLQSDAENGDTIVQEEQE